jgi:threonine dehydratase
MTVTLADIEAAARRLEGQIERTPCDLSRTLSEITGTEVWLKRENLQYTASFKDRGAYNRLVQLPEEARRRGVIAMSAGNHAQGVAYHARRLGIPATIVMPTFTPFVKVENTRRLGARVLLEGAGVDEAAVRAHALAEEEGLTFIHPFDDEAVIAPAQAGGPTIAEGIAVKEPGGLTLPIIERLVHEVLLVEEGAIEAAILLLLEVEKTVAEGAGAAGLAALMSYPERFRGRKVGLIVCGGNIDSRLLSAVILRGLVRTRRLVRLRVGVPDSPGSLAQIASIIGEAGGNVVDVVHQRAFSKLSVKLTDIDFTIEVRGGSHADEIAAALAAAGFTADQLGPGDSSGP